MNTNLNNIFSCHHVLENDFHLYVVIPGINKNFLVELREFSCLNRNYIVFSVTIYDKYDYIYMIYNHGN